MKRVRKGSMTVEAAFVVPVVIFVICAICYMGFYLHDKAVAESVMQRGLERYNLRIKSMAAMDTGKISYDDIVKRGLFYYLGDMEMEELETYLERELQGGLRIMKVNRIQTEYAWLTLNAEAELEMEVSIPVVSSWLNKKVRCITCNVKLHMPEEFARMYDTWQTFMDDSGKSRLDEYYSGIWDEDVDE